MSGYIDVNVSLGNWPFQRFDAYSPAQLEKRLNAEGITQAWVSAIDSVLFPEPDLHDWLLFRKLRNHPSLKPVKTVDPTLPNWRQSLDEAVEKWGVHAIKLFPNYDGYELSDARVDALMEASRERGLVTLVQIRLEDERGQYPLMRIPAVPAESIAELAKRHPAVPVVALCASRPELAMLNPDETPNVHAELSMLDGADVIESALETFPASRLLFGSHTPFLYTRSAIMKMQFADIPAEQLAGIGHANASQLQEGRLSPALA